MGNEGLKYICEKMNFKELKKLILSGNNISNIKVLAKFEKLEILDLSDNKISNIELLETFNFTELKELFFMGK